MRITERTGLIYTALFLTVSAGLITQNADTLMASFRGETNVQAVDDIFTVHAGREQRLFVLSNDVDSNNIPTSEIRLINQPACGRVTKTGGTFTYSQSTSCSGHQSFSYCLNTGLGCEPASVALRLVEARDPIDSVTTGPVVELSGFETQVGFNSRELEITNVHLGKAAGAETTTVPVTGAKLARVAVEAPVSVARPTTLGKLDPVDGVFTMENMADPDASAIDTSTMVEVAATHETVNDASVTSVGADLSLPTLPSGAVALRLSQANDLSLTSRMVKIDLGFRAPTVMAGIDNSPFGTPCSVALDGRTVDGGLVAIDLSAPCLPNSRIEVLHGKLKVTLKTDHTGNLLADIPAFEVNARFLLTLPDGTQLRISATVPELEHIDRVAIQWRGDFAVDLHVLEFGAVTGGRGHVWQGQPGAIDQATRNGGGYVTRLGDETDSGASLIEVYSLPLSNKTKSGVIDFSVSAMPTRASCSQSGIVQSLRSRGGRLVGASGVEFALPDCGNSPQHIVLKNVVRDLIIASR